MNDELTLIYENDRGNARVTREWRKISDSVVREIDKEEMYDYPNEQWEVVHCHSRDYRIDESGRLIGDGSNWDGEGELWREWAEKRHNERIRIRFPYDFDESDFDESRKGDRELIKEIAAKNA